MTAAASVAICGGGFVASWSVAVYRARRHRERVAARYPIANRYRRPGWAERH